MSPGRRKRKRSSVNGPSPVPGGDPVKASSAALTGAELPGRSAANGAKSSFNASTDVVAGGGLPKGGGGPDSNWIQLQALLNKSGQRKRKKPKPPAEPAQAITEPEAAVAEAGKATSLTPVNSDFSVTKHIALDCEMVGVGHKGSRNALARVALVNKWGNVIYDKHVRPLEPVTDWRTKISGIRKSDLKTAAKFCTVQQEVANLLSGRKLIGHALHNDLKVLLLSHPRKDTRDSLYFRRFRSHLGQPQSLQRLAAQHLGVTIQEGEHNPVEDARAAMLLYQRFKAEWESSLWKRYGAHKSEELLESRASMNSNCSCVKVAGVLARVA